MPDNILTVHCNKCGGDRRHDVLHHVTRTWSESFDDDGLGISGSDEYHLVKCCGCEAIALRHQSWFSEDIDEQGCPNVTTELYPPASYRAEPKWLHDLAWSMPLCNNFLDDLIKEIYIALRNRSLRLAVMGMRSLLEHIMIDKVGDHGSFAANLNTFEHQGFVSRSQRAVLEPVLEAGHAVMHRSFKPSTGDVGVLMDIVESIIESIYVNEHRASQVSKNVPPRGKK